eukprot:TRINITY_DN49156_c0_g1_i1.p1 TRINITY_DN49156_c0_g1~~TRINITY_DN49156_c0_g1_i1.p1  ORF type:complete len:500 (-),score=64.64 TRINITY_DN49156_c0_g1_i1:58-1500(-)
MGKKAKKAQTTTPKSGGATASSDDSSSPKQQLLVHFVISVCVIGAAYLANRLVTPSRSTTIGGFRTNKDVRKGLLLELGQENISGSCDLEVLDAADPEVQANFKAKYYQKKPVVLRNLGPIPDGFTKDQLKSLLGSYQVAVGRGEEYAAVGAAEGKVNFGTFIDNLTAEAQLGRFVYSIGGNVAGWRDSFWESTEVRSLMKQLLPGWPPFDAATGLPHWQLKGKDWCPTNAKDGDCWMMLNVGGPGVGAHLHFHTSTWARLLYGEKYWILSPLVNLPEPGFNPLDRIPQIRKLARAAGGTHSWLECVQKPGDLLYIPEGWYHAVSNLGETLAVGVQVPKENSGSLVSAMFQILSSTESPEEQEVLEEKASRLTQEHPGLFKAWAALTRFRLALGMSVESVEEAALGAAKANSRDLESQLLLTKVRLEMGKLELARESLAKVEELLLLGPLAAQTVDTPLELMTPILEDVRSRLGAVHKEL